MPPAVAKPVMSAIQVGRFAAQPAEAGVEEEPPGTDTRRLAFAGWPGHNWCKMQRRRRVVFHILDKTFCSPKLPACLKSTHRTRACYSTRNQRVNMQNAAVQPALNSNRPLRTIRPTMRIRENINRSCTAQAPSLRLVRPTKREELSCEFISPLPQRFSEPHSPP
jgi:hypothetical protein